MITGMPTFIMQVGTINDYRVLKKNQTVDIFLHNHNFEYFLMTFERNVGLHMLKHCEVSKRYLKFSNTRGEGLG